MGCTYQVHIVRATASLEALNDSLDDSEGGGGDQPPAGGGEGGGPDQPPAGGGEGRGPDQPEGGDGQDEGAAWGELREDAIARWGQVEAEGIDQQPSSEPAPTPEFVEDVRSDLRGEVVSREDERLRPPTWEELHPEIQWALVAVADAFLRKRGVPEATPKFATEDELATWLVGWAKDRWKNAVAHGVPDSGTGRSSNPVIPVRWLGEDALVKISSEPDTLLKEAHHLDELEALGEQLNVVKSTSTVEVEVYGDKWAAYVMPRVGDLSLRDHMFIDYPKPRRYLEPLCNGLAALYANTIAPNCTTSPTLRWVSSYLLDIRACLTKLQTYASLVRIGAFDERGVQVISGPGQAGLIGPFPLLSQWLSDTDDIDASLHGLEPAFHCHVHGDLHFENIRVAQRESSVAGAFYWLIDPKPFSEGDYVYDLAKLLSSLTGHAHVDRGRWGAEISVLQVREASASPPGIYFNCWLRGHQLTAFTEAFEVVHSAANGLAHKFERAGPDQESAMKRRLLLALARHFFSAARYFDLPNEQQFLFARGATFLNLFARSLERDAAAQEWDPFDVRVYAAWLGPR